jgi:hypothetical protein
MLYVLVFLTLSQFEFLIWEIAIDISVVKNLLCILNN